MTVPLMGELELVAEFRNKLEDIVGNDVKIKMNIIESQEEAKNVVGIFFSSDSSSETVQIESAKQPRKDTHRH
ncbi:hypothetical protein SY88_02935 [Clostridiales bacterium PH28_bin88]|nr:hypothetical protein SY88_02935 [Clostridiales bacterium PH28_bin88]